ncbi:ArnT family glycosyltransferase [Acuticoccus mangrovi]|uniref:Glycosyltransferase family 39 protein n=1 Tax=Acuticoccus mangrovi TaxID=2796142 RepID=A0A934IKT4_9HYPH|nr:glycosyltransferase family 39 protein [Acuticoccus mangrovi]MBJ3778338.1 glycosyltransferase family 39 protein [Acuticoccus mangrovi]
MSAPIPSSATPAPLPRGDWPAILPMLLLLATVLLSLAPGIASIPPIDRDEPRYTQATKQMVETGDYVRIRFQEAPRHKKPIGIHWLQAAAVTLYGEGAAAPLWVYRVPSLLGAMAAVLLAVWAARAFLPFGGALTVGALLGATIIVGVEARLAKTDAVLLATVVAMMGALARIWLAERKGWAMPLLFWVALALGILVKGPIAPMVMVLTVATLLVVDGRRLLSRMRFLVGLPIVAAICLPWFVGIYIATDGAFYSAALGHDFLGKAAGGQEGHGAPPLVHLAFFLAVAWPLAPLTLAAAWRIWQRRGAVFVYAFAWVVPSWIVFELVPTKLPHYTLPVVPGIALAVVAALHAASPPRWLARVAAVYVAAVPVAVLVAIPVGFLLFATPIPWVALPVAALAAASAVAAARALFGGASPVSGAVIVPTVAAAVVAQVAVWGLALPKLSPVWVSPRLVAAADAAAGCPDPRLISIGFNEPSMIFLAGTDTGLLSPEQAVAALDGHCAVIAARARFVGEVEAAAATAGVAIERVGEVDGFNISKGDPVALTLFRNAPTAD